MQIFTDIFVQTEVLLLMKFRCSLKARHSPDSSLGEQKKPVFLSPQLPGKPVELSLPSTGHLGPSEFP